MNINLLLSAIKLFLNNKNFKWGTIFITRRCNYNCPYCNVSDYPNQEISLKDWFIIIDRLVSEGVASINIVGGEPTLWNDLEELIYYINSKSIPVFLHSNLFMVTESKIDDLISSGISGIQTSIDSFDGFGKKLSFQKQYLLEKARQKGVFPLISSVITKENVREIKKIAEYAISHNFIYNCGLYQNVGGIFSPSSADLIAPYEEVSSLFSQLKSLKDSYGNIKLTKVFLNNDNLFSKYYIDKWKCNPHGDHWVIINSDGTLMPCEEYPSNFNLLDKNWLKTSEWRLYRKKIVDNCPGCYHHCYFEAENINKSESLKELKSIMKYVIRNKFQKNKKEILDELPN